MEVGGSASQSLGCFEPGIKLPAVPQCKGMAGGAVGSCLGVFLGGLALGEELERKLEGIASTGSQDVYL